MSADSNVVFFGIRIILPPEDIKSINFRKHPLIARARECKLQTYYGNFGGIDPIYYLLIGRKIGVTGPEHEEEVEVPAEECLRFIREVQEKLEAGEFGGDPKLYTIWKPDA